MRRVFVFVAALLWTLPAVGQGSAAKEKALEGSWQFAVSGDSRNCGDVVMPGIAASVLKTHVEFYWHLGDFRKIYDFDEDMQHEPEFRSRPLTIMEYEDRAWADFIENQIMPFGSLPVFLGIGNHETIPPKTREEFLTQFADWLDAAALQKQRLRDDPRDHRLKTYFHWVQKGVDFINLDNASYDQFDLAQVVWVERLLERDAADAEIKAVVVGMHRALPDSISAGHSMNNRRLASRAGGACTKRC